MTLCVVVERLLLFVKQFVLMRLGMRMEMEMGGLKRVLVCNIVYMYNVYECSEQSIS